jgi:hypothetical protein
MVTGIGVIGIFTATLTSYFFDSDRESANEAFEQRLIAIEQTLERIERQLDTRRSGGSE